MHGILATFLIIMALGVLMYAGVEGVRVCVGIVRNTFKALKTGIVTGRNEVKSYKNTPFSAFSAWLARVCLGALLALAVGVVLQNIHVCAVAFVCFMWSFIALVRAE
ncbi:hypothetical protein LS71_002770 [Helicobacter jaachi]|uniref:Uncharacterized protein n=1 Tax=Helicobacter jaachi TaxID=1677920 RepID=A0A4U8TCJ6_9HELI|nr:hypothetical protein [Helicobacter jaachi]TLD97681.1 hypothetical protein LS71_002770 [Helicobacter jaachi]